MEIELDEDIFGVKKWEKCTVISNNNEATFIKRTCASNPWRWRSPFRAGGYIQTEAEPITWNTQIRYSWGTVVTGISSTYSVTSLSLKNIHPLTLQWLHTPEEKGIIKLNVRIATPPPNNTTLMLLLVWCLHTSGLLKKATSVLFLVHLVSSLLRTQTMKWYSSVVVRVWRPYAFSYLRPT